MNKQKTSSIIGKLLAVCKKYVMPDSIDVVIKEPYIPFIPNKWNGMIVLAESQNLSWKNQDYVDYLYSLTPNERIKRLNFGGDEIGVEPWDDGSLKLAVEAAFRVKALETSVSNAVLWSQRGDSEENVNPDFDLQEVSSKLWTEILGTLNPNVIICSGKIADSIINNAGWNGKIINLRLPSKTAMSRISGMFDEEDLLRRYPEVKVVIDNNPEWLDSGYLRNKIFFACHAVSLYNGTKNT
ncbi:MAG: hypothetical protein V2I97_12635 [Desulfococcaceae bacterium]|jgi:hypothetical protein|nr:hypothetical protein [Desulfococcaceae bacterium]